MISLSLAYLCNIIVGLFLQSQDKKLPVDSDEATRRVLRMEGNFEELMDDYLSRRVPIIPGVCVCVCVRVHMCRARFN